MIVACRDGRVYNIKEGDVRGTAVLTGNVIDAGSQIICIARQDKVLSSLPPSLPPPLLSSHLILLISFIHSLFGLQQWIE